MDTNTAHRILDQIEAAARSHPKLNDLVMDLKRRGVEYAHTRACWAFLSVEEKADNNAQRSRLHDVFIDSCNVLSRAMLAAGLDNSWRELAGHGRKEIGDLASHLHCILGLRHR